MKELTIVIHNNSFHIVAFGIELSDIFVTPTFYSHFSLLFILYDI